MITNGSGYLSKKMDHSAMALTRSICTERMLVDLLQTRRLRDIYFVGLKLWCTWQKTVPLELSLLVSPEVLKVTIEH